jgi:ketosteroid isomerase-like protein
MGSKFSAVRKPCNQRNLWFSWLKILKERKWPASGYTLDVMITRLGLALLFLLASSSVLAQDKLPSAELEARDALAKFVYAFDNLDWEGFRQAFDDDATVFYPRAFPERANGRAKFEKTFKMVFEQIRNGRTEGPYMDIKPRDMKIQLFANVAISTFHLDDRTGFVNRRTIVLKKTNAGWKIVHLHASEVPVTNMQR